MKTLNTGYYQADTQNGVTFIGDILEDENQDVINQRLFLNGLKNLDDNETIVTFFDCESFDILAEIEQEYGIR